MLDIKLFRDEPEVIRAALELRGEDSSCVDRIAELDSQRRELLYEVEQMKARQNAMSKKIPQLKKAGEDTTAIFAEMKELSDAVKAFDDRLREVDAQIQTIVLNLPNIPSSDVPHGATDEDNLEIRRNGEPRNFEFEPKAHWDIGEGLGILDFATGAKVTGARFTVYRGLGARLERSLINFFLDTHAENGYTEILPPFMVHRASMMGTGQLPKFEEDAFKISDSEYFLVPTAEVPVTNMLRDEIVSGAELPIRFAAYSACFRSEAGSAGRDTRGLIRQHQFNKVELVKFTKPEQSADELEKLTSNAERILQLLGLPYRTVKLCTGDLGFSSAKTYDIEVWMPSYGRFVEISSCSNFGDFQARRANIKFKKTPTDKAQFVHTLNGSGLAVGRCVAAILENYQNEDGSVTVPEVLRKYVGAEIIK